MAPSRKRKPSWGESARQGQNQHLKEKYDLEGVGGFYIGNDVVEGIRPNEPRRWGVPCQQWDRLAYDSRRWEIAGSGSRNLMRRVSPCEMDYLVHSTWLPSKWLLDRSGLTQWRYNASAGDLGRQSKHVSYLWLVGPLKCEVGIMIPSCVLHKIR